MKKRILLILVLALCSAACVAVADSAVVYFSCTGTTEKIAEWVAEDTGADLFRILPKEPYTEEDLKYYTDCRADREQADDTARPEISANFGRPVRTFRNQRYAHSGLIGTSISDKRYAFLYTDHKAV